MAKKVTSTDVLIDSAAYAAFSGVSGWLGKYSLSFFRPDITNLAGGFGNFAGVGLIAQAFRFIPAILAHNLLNSSRFLEEYPNAKALLENTSKWMLTLGSTALAAMAIGLPPFGATVICMMVIPTFYTLLSNVVTLINACNQYTEEASLASGFAY